MTVLNLPRSPLDSLEKLGWRDFERPCKLGERVDLGNPATSLKQADLGAVERGSKRKLLLSNA